MNKLSLILSLAFLILACTNSGSINTNDAIVLSNYDELLASKLGADDYGMRSYVFATLLTGPNDANITNKQKREELFKGHFSNMSRLAEEGKLVLAGPFIEGEPKRGLFILNVASIEEAQVLVQSDPSIAAGIFQVELTKYYGSAALMQVNETHQKIQKIQVN